ncbi:hypothetical protein [Demequina pelophila]|uniref:hypothetical protein n=1 Tax=Demequina pelophila TaxID=1638984 RepID=UPI000784A89F|nr:hypothetical protein [Demequina pelophila]
MDTTGIIGIVAGLAALAVVVMLVVNAMRRGREHTPPEPHHPDPAAGRGPTGQEPDPSEGTPSSTSTPHWDRRPEGREGPL